MRFKNTSDFKTATTSFRQSHKRIDYIADINYRARKLELLARGMITGLTPSEETELEDKLRAKVILYYQILKILAWPVNRFIQCAI